MAKDKIFYKRFIEEIVMENRRKRILHIVWSLNNGGIETMLVNIANHQCEMYEVGVMIVNLSYDESLISTLSKDIHVFLVNRPMSSKNPFYYAKLNVIYRKFAPDIVHFHQLSLAKIFVKRKSDKWFYTQHCIPNTLVPNKNITTYIAISQCVKEGMLKLSNIKNCVVCYNGVDFERIIEKEQYNDVSLQFRAVSVARLDTKIKGQDTIIEAVNLLPDDIKKIFTIDIYGDGPDKHLIEEMIKHYKLENEVHLQGNISNKKLLSTLKDYDLSIHPSRIEGFGLSAVESMGCGLPVILSDVLGHSEICPNRISFMPDDAMDLAQKIAYCVNYYSKVVELSHKNKEYVKDKFSIQKMVEELNDIYKLNK